MRKSTLKLSKHDWLDEALQVLAESGLEAVAVESLAKRLGVTKGSFYWHFKNRQELIVQLLEFWQQLEQQYISEYEMRFEKPEVFLKEVLSILINDDTNKCVFLALSKNTQDMDVRQCYELAIQRRIELFTRAYKKLKLTKKSSSERALQTYCAYYGLIKLMVDNPAGIINSATQKKLISNEIERALHI